MAQLTDNKTVLKKPYTKRLVVLSIFACSLLISIATAVHHKHVNYTKRVLSLPSLDDETGSDEDEQGAKNNDQWRTVITSPGDTLGSIFKKLGLSPKDLQLVMQNNTYAKNLTNIKLNQKLRFLIQDNKLQQLIFPMSATQSLMISKEGDHFRTSVDTRQMTSQNHYITITVSGSLFGTAKRMGIPYKLIQQMTDIFNWEIDFAKDVRSGDTFTIAYKAYYIENKMVDTGEILAVTYTNKGKAHKAFLYQNKNGTKDYYNENGMSLRKAFVRYPIKFSHISSTFALSRWHPILHYNRPHKGVDLAAAIGTPIHATGDGRIEMIGRHSGYGNMIKISHNKIYSTVYGHMLRFQKGLSKGSLISRGQVIGYVGQTGLATAPHCHYEFQVNHNPKNPSTIDLPRSMPIPADEFASFMTNTNSLLAQMKLYEEANLAAVGKKTLDMG